MVTILYFARLKEVLGTAREELALTPTVHTLSALRETLMSRGGVWADELSTARPIRAAVNQEMVKSDAPLRDGDEVAFFPPVTGG
jgi:sulfur-carrier protein